MKIVQRFRGSESLSHAAAIDLALRSVAAIEPRTGFEGRLIARLAAVEPVPSLASRRRFRNRGLAPWLALGLVGGSLVCAAVLVAAPGHDRPIIVVPGPTVTVRAGAGFGAASAVHHADAVADASARPSQGTQSEGGKPHRARGARATERSSAGRAILHSPPLHKVTGSATPASPYTQRPQ